MNDFEQVSVSFRGTREQGFELLQRLSEDDNFRRQVEGDPVAMLEQYGFDMTGAVPPVAKLAPKWEIKAMLWRMGRDEGNPFGNVEHETWRFRVLCVVYKFAALPFVERRPTPHDAR